MSVVVTFLLLEYTERICPQLIADFPPPYHLVKEKGQCKHGLTRSDKDCPRRPNMLGGEVDIKVAEHQKYAANLRASTKEDGVMMYILVNFAY